MSRATIVTFASAAALGLALGAASSARAAHDDGGAPKPCVHKSFKTPQVKKACKEGGQKAAKALMKKVVKKAKAAGEKINCKTCHTSLKTFDYKPEAVDALKKWL